MTRHDATPWAVAIAGGLTLLAACGGSPQPAAEAPVASASPFLAADEPQQDPPAVGRRPSLQERLVMGRLARIAARVRQLDLVEPVQVAVHGRRAIVDHLTTELDEEDLEQSRLVYTALGLLPEGLDLRALLERVLGEQVVGYYDHETDQLVIRDDVMQSLQQDGQGAVDEARVTIVHELVHALQDQRLALGELAEVERDTDADAAYHAVVEGDATLAMIAYLTEQSGGRLEWLTRNPQLLRNLVGQASPMSDQELGAAPAIVRVTLMSSYLDGLLFAAAIHGRGGFGAVDQAHRDPPVSMEQVLHPERYLAREIPDDIEIPALSALADEGFELLEEDTLGELEMSVYLGQTEPDGVDSAAAAGWSGDRLQVYRAEARSPAVVWFTAWDDGTEAQEAAHAAQRVAELFPPDQRDSQSVVRIGRGVLIVRHLPPSLHSTVHDAFGRFATGLPASPPRAPAPP